MRPNEEFGSPRCVASDGEILSGGPEPDGIPLALDRGRHSTGWSNWTVREGSATSSGTERSSSRCRDQLTSSDLPRCPARGGLPTIDYTCNMNQLDPGGRLSARSPTSSPPRAAFGLRDRRPRPPDVALLIEVSDTTYVADSGELLRAICRRRASPNTGSSTSGLRSIEVYTDPDAEGRSSIAIGSEYGLDAEPFRWPEHRGPSGFQPSP